MLILQVPPINAETALAGWQMLFMAVALIASLVAISGGLRLMFKKTPPDYQVYSTIAQHNELRQAVMDGFNRVHGRIDKAEDDRRSSVSRCYSKMEEELAKVRDRLDVQGQTISHLAANQEATVTTLANHDLKLDRIIDRVSVLTANQPPRS
jgi:hypothetical protein